MLNKIGYSNKRKRLSVNNVSQEFQIEYVYINDEMRKNIKIL